MLYVLLFSNIIQTRIMGASMKRISVVVLFSVLLLFSAGLQSAVAHFGTLTPTTSMVTAEGPRKVQLTLSFIHPFEQHGMELVKPKEVKVMIGGHSTSLLPYIKKTTLLNHSAWKFNYKFRRPGSYAFYMEPTPYWEPAEDCYIIHYTKTVVAAFGDDSGWEDEIGLKTEIVPVTRPFGLYTNNLFQGIVKMNGKPVPWSTVEVEYLNTGGKASAPDELMITQTIKADGNGLFSYAAPKAGWWGFAALNEADYKLSYKGQSKDVELGAVIWVQFLDWNSSRK